MKVLAALLLLTTLVACAGPAPEPVGEAAVVEPAAACRADHDGRPLVADRGIGGTGAPANRQVADRGIGGTGVVGVVTGFASICVAGLEVGFDKRTPVSIDGTAGSAGLLRVGQQVVIKTGGVVPEPGLVARALTIDVRHEVSGPIEAVDAKTGTMVVAGQRVMIVPATWTAARLAEGNWISVSGLRQPDGTIIASRLDPVRPGAFTVRGQIRQDGDATRIGDLMLHEPALASVKAGTFVSIRGRYRNGVAEPVTIDTDLLAADPASYFGISTDQLIVQGFARVEQGTVVLSNGQKFQAAPAVQGSGSGYRNAIVWLKRATDGVFTATALRYTSYRARPADAPFKATGHGAGSLVLPPDVPPAPPSNEPPADDGVAPDASPGGEPSSDAAPPQPESSPGGATISDQALPAAAIPRTKLAAGD